MKLEEIEAIEDEFISTDIAAAYIQRTTPEKSKPQAVRDAIRKQQVPWGYIVGTSTIRIPKQAFINYHRYGGVVTVEKR
jgi:hypothetical protein